jgi:hypothetical protein
MYSAVDTCVQVHAILKLLKGLRLFMCHTTKRPVAVLPGEFLAEFLLPESINPSH